MTQTIAGPAPAPVTVTGPAPAPVTVTESVQAPVTEAPPTTPPTPTHSVKPPHVRKTTAHYTPSEDQAIGSAQDYLRTQAFSRTGLIQQLPSKYGEGFSVADATFAVDHIQVNWFEKALKSARQYLSTQHFSRDGLIQQLTFSYGEGFTLPQATYAVDHVGL